MDVYPIIQHMLVAERQRRVADDVARARRRRAFRTRRVTPDPPAVA